MPKVRWNVEKWLEEGRRGTQRKEAPTTDDEIRLVAPPPGVTMYPPGIPAAAMTPEAAVGEVISIIPREAAAALEEDAGMRIEVGGFGRIGTYWGVAAARPANDAPSTPPAARAAAVAPALAAVDAAGSIGSGLPVREAQARRKSRSPGSRLVCGIIRGRIPTQAT